MEFQVIKFKIIDIENDIIKLIKKENPEYLNFDEIKNNYLIKWINNKEILNNSNKFHSKIIVINLEKRNDRWENFQKKATKIGLYNYTKLNAFDGYGNYDDQTIKLIKLLFRNNKFSYRKGIIGCALSHLKIWINLANSNENYCLILEDDINFCPNFKVKLNLVLNKIDLKGFNIVFLGYTSLLKLHCTDYFEIDELNVAKDKYVGGTFGYVITKSAAVYLYRYFMGHSLEVPIDIYVTSIMSCKKVTSPLVTSICANGNKNIDSNIQHNLDSF